MELCEASPALHHATKTRFKQANRNTFFRRKSSLRSFRQTLVLSTFIHKVRRHWSLKSQGCRYFSLLYKSSFGSFILTTAAVVLLSVLPWTQKRRSRNGNNFTHTAGPQWQVKVEEIRVSVAVINLSNSSKRTLAWRTLVHDVNLHTALTSRLWSALS